MSDRPDIPGVIAKPPTIYSAAVVIALVLHLIMPLPISSAPVRLWIGLSVIVREERYLVQKFGQVYQDYKASVRRWF